MARYCRSCGAELRDGAKFCEACGTKVPEEKPEKSFCTSCGKELAPDAAFCTFCGAKKNARPVQPLRETPSNPPSVSERQVPAEKDVPDYMRRGYNQRLRAERDAVRNAAKPKKKGRGLSIFLALVFLAEFVTAAYKYPGFMNKIKTVTASDNPYVKVIDVSSESADKSLMRAVSPGNPANLTIIPDATKIAKIHPVTAQVSPEAPVCRAGDITADFGMWNLEEEDMFEVRALGTAEDEVNDCTCTIYDLSLSSGKHEFDTAVTVTVPRTAGEYDGKIIHYNEELGEWEPTAFEISDDGRWYHVRLYHFSEISEVFSTATKRVALDTVSASNVSMFSALESKTSFYMKPGGGREWVTTKYPMLQMPITFNEESFYYLIKRVKIEKLEPEYISKLAREGRIDEDYYASVMLSTLGTGLDIGGQLTGAVGGELGDSFSALGIALTASKLLNDLKNEPDTAKVIEKDWSDIVSALTSAAGFYPPASMACFLFGVLFYYIQKGIVYVEDHNPMDMQDAVYRYYMNRHSGSLLNEDNYLKLTGKGWSWYIDKTYEMHKSTGTLSSLEADLESALDQYIESFWKYMDESDRRSICIECVKNYTYLIAEEPLSAQYYLDMEGGWEEPAKAYPAEYMRNAKDILCRNVKSAFEAMALKYLDETETQLKKDIYSTILPELNEYMIFEMNPAVIENYLESPYINKEPFYVDGEYVFNYLYPYSYSEGNKETYKNAAGDDKLTIRFAPDLKAFFRPYEVNVLFKPLNMQNYDFSASYVPHARFGYKKMENYTMDGDFIALHGWIYQNLIELKNPENIVFVCKKYYYLMVGCPETMQMKDPRDKNASWTDCKLEIAERSKFSIYDLDMNLIRSAQYSDSMKGVDTGGRLEYIYITPGSVPEEKKPDEKPVSYNMVLKSDLLIEYAEPSEKDRNGDWFTYTPYGADNTITIKGKEINISLNAIDYVWKNSSFGGPGESMVFTFKRDSVSAAGTLEEEWESDGYIKQKYTLANPPAISGSYKEEKDWDTGRRYYDNKYSASEWKSINSYSLTKEYKMTSVSFGYVVLIFDSTREKLISADVSISGSGTESWRYDDRYADAMKDVIQGSGSENKGVSFGMTLRAPD